MHIVERSVAYSGTGQVAGVASIYNDVFYGVNNTVNNTYMVYNGRSVAYGGTGQVAGVAINDTNDVFYGINTY